MSANIATTMFDANASITTRSFIISMPERMDPLWLGSSNVVATIVIING